MITRKFLYLKLHFYFHQFKFYLSEHDLLRLDAFWSFFQQSCVCLSILFGNNNGAYITVLVVCKVCFIVDKKSLMRRQRGQDLVGWSRWNKTFHFERVQKKNRKEFPFKRNWALDPSMDILHPTTLGGKIHWNLIFFEPLHYFFYWQYGNMV